MMDVRTTPIHADGKYHVRRERRGLIEGNFWAVENAYGLGFYGVDGLMLWREYEGAKEYCDMLNKLPKEE